MLLILVGVVSFSALAAPAQDTGGGGDDVMIVKCEPFIVDFVLPPNGASDVSPQAVPAVAVTSGCGDPYFLVTLTGPGAEVQTSEALLFNTALWWFPDLLLGPDGSYLMSVQTTYVGEPPIDGLASAFSTGSGAIVGFDGTLTVEILGSEFSAGAQGYTVSLAIQPAGGPGDAWELLRGAQVVGVGVSTDTQFVDSVFANVGDEICYTLHEYTADGALVGISEPACVTEEGFLGGICSCGTGAPAPASAALLLGAAMVVRRRRGPAGCDGRTA